MPDGSAGQQPASHQPAGQQPGSQASDLPSAQQWLAAFAKELDLPAPDPTSTEILLELAGEAAHSSERIAAPIACWLVGIAGLDPADALAKAKRIVADISA